MQVKHNLLIYSWCAIQVMASYELNYLQLADLLYALDHFPPKTPKRWEEVADYMSKRKALYVGSGGIATMQIRTERGLSSASKCQENRV